MQAALAFRAKGSPDLTRAELDTWQWVAVAVAIAAGLYGLLVGILVLAGRGSEARALARFIPDCLVLFRRLVRDPRVTWWRKGALVLLVGYLAMPFDLVPDFIPVAGQLDDALIVAIVLRTVLRAGGPDLLRQHWPGPTTSLNVLTRLAYGHAGTSSSD